MLYTGKYEEDATQIVLNYLQDAVEKALDYIRYPEHPPTPEKLEQLEVLRQGVKEAHFRLELICGCFKIHEREDEVDKGCKNCSQVSILL